MLIFQINFPTADFIAGFSFTIPDELKFLW